MQDILGGVETQLNNRPHLYNRNSSKYYRASPTICDRHEWMCCTFTL